MQAAVSNVRPNGTLGLANRKKWLFAIRDTLGQLVRGGILKQPDCQKCCWWGVHKLVDILLTQKAERFSWFFPNAKLNDIRRQRGLQRFVNTNRVKWQLGGAWKIDANSKSSHPGFTTCRGDSHAHDVEQSRTYSYIRHSVSGSPQLHRVISTPNP